MQLLFIVIPCAVIGIGVAALLDRSGLLPSSDRSGRSSTRAVSSLSSIVRPFSLGAVVILATWILAWLVVLAVGLNLILSSS
ncbi:MAG: hypothetical protein M3083_02615 [Actinomycetota bacterium]|nr:hypothetical protein [Actinomycetota bacterium]